MLRRTSAPVAPQRPAAVPVATPFEIETHELIESTQVRARERVLAGLRQPAVVIAQAQSAGRGQRGRSWHSPPGAAVYLTLIWPSARRLAGLSGLSLVVGLSVRACLAQWQINGQLKWPNDVWVEQRKIAGILVELVADRRGSVVLIGVGLNVALPPSARAAIDQPCIDMAELLPTAPSTDQVISALLPQLQIDLQRFEYAGLGPFLAAWHAADALSGRSIWLKNGSETQAAEALGIDELGRLRVRIADQERLLVAGEVSIRPA